MYAFSDMCYQLEINYGILIPIKVAIPQGRKAVIRRAINYTRLNSFSSDLPTQPSAISKTANLNCLTDNLERKFFKLGEH